ncbi:hypothetical protein [Pseudomonas aeruginosa]|uniref:hypothetical protein n=1 Tax=Pseudomonas aeruginosa TaxID=287 RepID=UPI001F48E245|nr:hypothetical protein [Pseudomonas aeruginosa]MCF3988122.1 hypothetical protein [Pseudomonas aeruginosa]MCF4004079.1 hypothetical protein [Pseudomonas aeruginosa]
MSNELTDVRCPCGDEFQADSYDAGFIAGSGMCQNCDAALPPKDICTCPSGDGSLVHPCPAHPESVELAGGDERDLQGAQGERECGHAACKSLGEHHPFCKFVSDQDRAALAQPSPAIAAAPTYQFQSREIGESDWAPCDFRWYLYCSKSPEMDTRVVEVAAQPSPAQAEQAEAERPEVVAWQYRVTAGPQTGWSLWHPGKGEEFERSYTVERRPLMTIAQHEYIVGELWAVIAQLRQHKNDYMDSGQETYRALQNEIREREAEIARLDGLVSGRTAERDAALARIAELEKQEPVATIAKVPGEDWNGLHFYRDLQGMQPGTKLYAAPVAQAQHSVPEGVTIERDVAGTIHIKVGDFDFIQLQYQRPYTDNASTWKLAERIASLLAAAPGKEGV